MKENGILLQLKNVGYQAGETTILRGIRFNLLPGEFKQITGPSGCGKSTLLKIIASLLSPSEGEILFAGQDIATFSPETYRQQVSYCTQTPTLFGNTVYENLIFPWEIRNKRPERQQLVDDLARFDLSETLLEKNISALSGGEKQRISLIRNLQFLPQVLLLDEITSALDEKNKRNVNEMIHRYARDKQIGVLWVTHDKDEIDHADTIITLTPHAGEMQETRNERA